MVNNPLKIERVPKTKFRELPGYKSGATGPGRKFFVVSLLKEPKERQHWRLLDF